MGFFYSVVRGHMTIVATRTLKVVYCLTLLGAIVAAMVASSGWIGLAFGGGAFRSGLLIPVAILLVAVYRVISIFRKPAALDVNATGLFARGIRKLSIVLMWCGLLATIGLFFVKPITLAVFRSAGDGGVGYFVVGVYLVMLSALGVLGIIMFEVTRFLGWLFPANENAP